jgi:hypothetical protein
MGRASLVYYAAAIALALPTPAIAQQSRYSMVSGNDYLSVCESDATPDQTFCIAYTVGLFRGLTAGQYASQTVEGRAVRDVIFCAPASVTNAQIRDVVIKYLHDRPAIRQHPSDVLIYGALSDAWGCLKK